MGSRLGAVCFNNNAEAADAFFSGAGPFYTAGATSYLGYFEKTVGGVWQIKRQSIASNGTITNLTASNATMPTFPTCQPLDNFSDGMLLGWGVAAAMLAAYAVKFIAKGLHRDDN